MPSFTSIVSILAVAAATAMAFEYPEYEVPSKSVEPEYKPASKSVDDAYKHATAAPKETYVPQPAAKEPVYFTTSTTRPIAKPTAAPAPSQGNCNVNSAVACCDTADKTLGSNLLGTLAMPGLAFASRCTKVLRVMPPGVDMAAFMDSGVKALAANIAPEDFRQLDTISCARLLGTPSATLASTAVSIATIAKACTAAPIAVAAPICASGILSTDPILSRQFADKSRGLQDGSKLRGQEPEDHNICALDTTYDVIVTERQVDFARVREVLLQSLP
ncbi:uncharacterized protein MYCFIDRAFT_78160 [Pseudocercospora fijiensis CIRAD86]|uniref:Hydrophobin n=1 Tax=Pseudocercospora fijiensis (strain CIRAD86) TaxID=383855 RepID=M3A722_PSEFD|nr:uncharacterized protein MYCFIDRAFT_78160 [Pseudocercospora fijiensis CIRAD86]EME80421.1 hypothetical protein MYCFIDRAFT_78160 [Pseudocercospora fijiensis CIRAD86]